MKKNELKSGELIGKEVVADFFYAIDMVGGKKMMKHFEVTTHRVKGAMYEEKIQDLSDSNPADARGRCSGFPSVNVERIIMAALDDKKNAWVKKAIYPCLRSTSKVYIREFKVLQVAENARLLSFRWYGRMFEEMSGFDRTSGISTVLLKWGVDGVNATDVISGKDFLEEIKSIGEDGILVLEQMWFMCLEEGMPASMERRLQHVETNEDEDE